MSEQKNIPTNPSPELGPSIVFFTGGTALKSLSQALCKYTHNNVHLVTPFDSGGSSATLRSSFGMPAIGDARNRILALANPKLVPRAVIRLCESRLPTTGTREEILEQLYSLTSEKHHAWKHIPRLFAEPFRLNLYYFLDKMPPDFDPRLASIGNLIIAGGYLHHKHQWGPTLNQISRLLQVRGIVMPITTKSLHLGAELCDGSQIIGQHRITGYGQPSPLVPIKKLFLLPHDKKTGAPGQKQVVPKIHLAAETYIRSANAICYPMGSFYTSVLANLLPQGVGTAISKNTCPKLYIPNVGHDTEQRTLSVADAVAIILKTLREDAGDIPTEALLQYVLVDTKRGLYSGGVDKDGIEAQGVKVYDLPLLAKAHIHDGRLTAKAIMQQISNNSLQII